MNDRTEFISSEYKPFLAITAFRAEGYGFYLESHDIGADGRVMAGKPLMQETIQGIVDVFFDERKNTQNISGMIPASLLFFNLLPGGHYNAVWYRPAEERVLHFSQGLKIPTGKAWVPAMLYVVDKNQLTVFALKSNARPTEKTKLYMAPFHNVSEDGSVCLGSAKVKKPKQLTYDSMMKYWEDLFWLSEFSHVNGDNRTKSDLSAVWKKLLKDKKLKWSDIDELVSGEKKLTLKKITG